MRTKIKQVKTGGFMAKMSGQRNKAVIAVVLVGMMILMWVRVFRNPSLPQAAAAAAAITGVEGSDSGSHKKYAIKNLGEIAGRTNVLTRDVFSLSDWDVTRLSETGIDTRGDTGSQLQQQADETIRDVGKELKLEAISSGKNPQAFVSGSLVGRGEKLTIRKGKGRYEFDVVAIGDNTVTLAAKGVTVTLILTKPVDPAD